MQKHIFLFALSLSCLISVSCAFLGSKAKLTCNIESIQAKAWFQDKLAQQDAFSNENNWYKFIQYKEEVYVVQGSCCTNCRWRPVFYDCEGNKMTIANEDRKEMNDRWKVEGKTIWNGSNCE